MFSRGRLLLLLLVVAEPMARHLLVVLPLSVAAQDDVSVFVVPSKYGEDLVLVHLIDRPLLGVTAAVLLNNLRTVMSLHTFRRCHLVKPFHDAWYCTCSYCHMPWRTVPWYKEMKGDGVVQSESWLRSFV